MFDFEPIPENDVITEITDFEYHEFNHDSVFTTAYKRVSCFIHTLQLVVKIFELTPSFRSSLQTAYSIVKKVNKSIFRTWHVLPVKFYPPLHLQLQWNAYFQQVEKQQREREID